MKILAPVLIAIALLWPAAAGAELQWNLKKKGGQPYLEAFSGEEEGDHEFWAHCQKGGAIEIGVGADTNVGNGEGEKVTLTLSSAGRAATLYGVSRRSENYEMTAGTELRATVKATDPLFSVLGTGKPIAITGSIAKPVTWEANRLQRSVAAFLAACK